MDEWINELEILVNVKIPKSEVSPKRKHLPYFHFLSNILHGGTKTFRFHMNNHEMTTRGSPSVFPKTPDAKGRKTETNKA